MKGVFNRILRIDLTRERYETEEIQDEVYQRLLGGKGLGSWLLARDNPTGVDPLSPDNRIIFATGPATQTLVWGGSRYGVFTKSPLTGLYAASFSGGKVPEAISSTGFDAIVIHGRAEKLTLLEISPEGAIFHDGTGLAGKDTFETEALVRAALDTQKKKSWKTGTAVVGPAAEAGVSFAIIKNDGWRCAGRAGTGTVLGAKNIKAIFFSGDRKKDLHNPKALADLAKALAAESKDNPIAHAYKSMGTSQMVKVMNSANAFPTRYWARGQADHWEQISADALHSRCQVTPHACAKCFLACGRMTRVTQGRHQGLTLEGPEYETLYAFGGLCMVDQIEEIARLNHVCDSLGVDTITAGNLCAFAMKAWELKKSDHEIRFGDARGIEELLGMMVRREGAGAVLARGIASAARAWDMADAAVHVKGMEPAGYDPRVLKGMGLAYASSDRGACHLRATFYKPELAGMIPPDQIKDKARLFIDFEDRLTLFDSLVLCKFYRDLYPWELLGEIIEGTTGIDGSKENLSTIAGNISGLVRDFNLREGMTSEDETLPAAFHTPLEDSGDVITPEEMRTLMDDYVKLRGWAR